MPPAPTTSNFAFCTIAKRSWKFMTHEAPGDPDESCVFFLFRLLFFWGGKGVNCKPIHDYNYGYSFNFLLPVCKQDWTNKTTTPPKRIYLTKNQHLHQHISTLLSTILTIEYHFQFGEIYIHIHKYTSKTRSGSAKKTSKKPCFLPRVSNRSMVSTHPPWRKPTHHGHWHLTQDSLHSRIPGSRHTTGARHDLRSPASNYTKPGGKKSIQWMAVHLLFVLRRWIF